MAITLLQQSLWLAIHNRCEVVDCGGRISRQNKVKSFKPHDSGCFHHAGSRLCFSLQQSWTNGSHKAWRWCTWLEGLKTVVPLQRTNCHEGQGNYMGLQFFNVPWPGCWTIWGALWRWVSGVCFANLSRTSQPYIDWTNRTLQITHMYSYRFWKNTVQFQESSFVLNMWKSLGKLCDETDDAARALDFTKSGFSIFGRLGPGKITVHICSASSWFKVS